MQQVARSLGIPGRQGVSTADRMAMERLSRVLTLIPDLARWTPAEKRALVRIIKAKGAPRESAYIRLLREHPRLGRSLCDLVRAPAAWPMRHPPHRAFPPHGHAARAHAMSFASRMTLFSGLSGSCQPREDQDRTGCVADDPDTRGAERW